MSTTNIISISEFKSQTVQRSAATLLESLGVVATTLEGEQLLDRIRSDDTKMSKLRALLDEANS